MENYVTKLERMRATNDWRHQNVLYNLISSKTIIYKQSVNRVQRQ